MSTNFFSYRLPAARNASPNALLARRSLRSMLLLATLAFCSRAASASPITYLLTGVFSGSLGSTTFSDAEATFSFTGADTGNVTTPDGLFFSNNVGVATFQLRNRSAVSFLSSTLDVESEFGAAAFMDQATGFAVGELNYDTPADVLSVAGAPVSGDFVSFGATPERTSAGNLIITGATGSVSFQALTPAAAVTPEPTTLWLAGTGMLCVAANLRRRVRSR